MNGRIRGLDHLTIYENDCCWQRARLGVVMVEHTGALSDGKSAFATHAYLERELAALEALGDPFFLRPKKPIFLGLCGYTPPHTGLQ